MQAIVIATLLCLSMLGGIYWLSGFVNLTAEDEQANTIVAPKELTARERALLRRNKREIDRMFQEEGHEIDIDFIDAAEEISHIIVDIEEMLAMDKEIDIGLAAKFERDLPTPEEIADPGLYREFELNENNKVRKLYDNAKKRIPLLETEFETARLSGYKSAEELEDIANALTDLRQLADVLERKFPYVTDFETAATSLH